MMWDFVDPADVADIPSIPQLLARGAEAHPHRVVATFEGEKEWTWAEAHARSLQAAHLLNERGVKRGDRVVLFLGNSSEFLMAWWGASQLGAVVVPLNTSYRGRMLKDVLEVADAKVIVVDRGRDAQLQDCVRAETIVGAAEFSQPRNEYKSDYEYDMRDPHIVVFTSGTTGPSKGSVTTYPQMFGAGSWIIDAGQLTSNDVFLVDMPMFHYSGLAPLLATLSVGGGIAVRTQPSMSGYWGVAKQTGATFSLTAGTMIEFLAKQPPSEADSDHRLRFMIVAPLPQDTESFSKRFGVKGFVTVYGTTEANLVAVKSLDMPIRKGTCGKARSGFEIRLVDDYDMPVPIGTVGQAIVRCTSPWLMTQGYLNNPTATVEAWKNGWFHTGDALWQDGDGYLYFHDRFKDAVRRRGENISSFEVEREVCSFPGVAEAACVPVPTDAVGDDEVKVFVRVKDEGNIDFSEMIQFLVQRMPHFMVPRYYELISEIPKTATHRAQKHKLREMGNSAGTWDSVAAGYKVTRNGLVINKS